MKLEVIRYSTTEESTLGILMDITDGKREFLCYTLEDPHQNKKIHGNTRIPAGAYELGLRKEGGFYNRYNKKFNGEALRKGMLHVKNVPNFKYILIHIGNTSKNTAGCLLLGDSSTQNISRDGFISNSKKAYTRVYPPIAEAIDRGDRVTITYTDFDKVDYF